ncbi:hypothetical protein [Haloarcula sp. JP-L23]|uniref:hypothetical protein n=1 Tax=Haloarcula sp. JP-L23 TaxID=2716717 RepID=UPI00140EC513|nr:hypothetical protein G9465_21695 [Haloarcula sp. JP-L23]
MSNPDDESSNRIEQLHLQFADDIDTADSIIKSDGGLVKWVQDLFGDELRLVGVYNQNTFELLYATTPIYEQYTQQEVTATGEEFVLSDMREDAYQEQLYHLGSYQYAVHGFEDGQVFRIPLEDTTGIVISFDRTADIPVPRFVTELKDHNKVVFQ